MVSLTAAILFVTLRVSRVALLSDVAWHIKGLKQLYDMAQRQNGLLPLRKYSSSTADMLSLSAPARMMVPSAA
ncbi:Cytochrome P450 monooxygenase verC [Trichinella spiralis]|uniref:Cytochrome P450 monooxygenase verC n=1 Tax=Trichinella spiralis TaxID=6334 RepID=A0ABR3KHY9_TRISP